MVRPPFDKLRAGSSAGSGEVFAGRRQALRQAEWELRWCQPGRFETGSPGLPYGRPGRGGSGQVSTVCRRCVQFPRQCVQFSPECVHFSDKCVQSVSGCVQSGLTTRSTRWPRRGGSRAVLERGSDGGLSPQSVGDGFGVGGRRESKGVHRVGVEVFSFCPNVFTFRANVFSFRRLPPRCVHLLGRCVHPGLTTQAARPASFDFGAA